MKNTSITDKKSLEKKRFDRMPVLGAIIGLVGISLGVYRWIKSRCPEKNLEDGSSRAPLPKESTNPIEKKDTCNTY